LRLLSFCTLSVLWSVASCTEDDSCSGPISDWPFCDDGSSGDTPTGLDPGEDGIGDADGADDSDTSRFDAGTAQERDGGSSDGGPDDGGCVAEPIACEGALTTLSVDGSAPQGAVHIGAVALGYTSGFTYSTQLTFDGTVAGQALRLSLLVPVPISSDPLIAAVPPGTYETSDGGFEIISDVAICDAVDPLAVSLEIIEHETVSLTAGGGGTLRGELTVEEGGWSLVIPFTIAQACSEDISL
jgi:hypothetical protein